MYLSIKIGEKIKSIRTNNNLSQRRFGYKIGVSGKTISSYETGRSSPSLEVLMKISEVFSVTFYHTSDTLKEDLLNKIQNIKKTIENIENVLA